ncbi:hypothetical protein [Frigoribacterium salinisoli]
MTAPAFTMLGDADAVACVGDSCALPGSSVSEEAATAGRRSDDEAPAEQAPAEQAPAEGHRSSRLPDAGVGSVTDLGAGR